MKVLHVIETLGCGGAERLLVTLLPEIGRQGVSAEVAVLRPPFDLKDELEAVGIPVTVMPYHYKWNLWANARNISDVAEKASADVIHAHLYFPTICTALAKVTGQTRSKTCTTFHNLAYGGANRPSFRLAVRRKLAKTLLPRGIDSMFAVSGAVSDLYRNVLGVDHVGVHHNPIDLEFVDQFAADDELPDDELKIVLPGRLVHEKGHLDLLDALDRLPEQDRRQIQILFAGEGPMRPILEAEIEARNQQGIVHILGELPHDAFLTVVAQSDIVVVPSRFEGFGLVALEAMALGRPIIASTSGGLPEVVDAAGKLVPPNQPDVLAQTLDQVINDRELRLDMGRRARERALQGFDVQAAATRLVEAYKAMLGTSIRPTAKKTEY